MTRTLVSLLLLALLAAPVALAQSGPPPGYTDPVAYTQDYAAEQAAQAQTDPVAYAQGKDAQDEAEHAAWLACWAAYEAADHALDAVCAAFFTAPVSVDPVNEVDAEITEVLNETGVSGLAGEALDAVNDTLADPTSAVDQVRRIAAAVVRFVKDLVETVLDLLGLGGLALAAGLLGGALGLLELARLPIDGLALAGAGLADLSHAIAAILGLAGTALATSSSAIGHGAIAAVLAVVGALGDAAQATAHGVGALLTGLGSALVATVGGVGKGLVATADAVGDVTTAVGGGIVDAADTVRDTVVETVVDVVDKVGSLFDGSETKSSADKAGLPDAPKTGTEADGLIDRLLGAL